MKNLEINEKDRPPFLEAIEDHPGFFVIRLRGDVNTHALEHNLEKMHRVFEETKIFRKPVLCDFGKVAHSDSATLGAIVYRFSEFRKRGGEKLVLFNVHGELKGLLEISHLTEFFTICESQEAAETALQNMP